MVKRRKKRKFPSEQVTIQSEMGNYSEKEEEEESTKKIISRDLFSFSFPYIMLFGLCDVVVKANLH